MTIRLATTDDVEGWLDVFEEVVAEGIWLGSEPPFDRDARREKFLAALADERSVRLVAVAGPGGPVVGQLSLDVAPYGVAHFGMAVAPAWRGQGVGGALVVEGVEAARRLGAHKVALEVWPHNGAARRLYRRHGFVEEGRQRRHYRRRNGELWDSVVMGRVLDEDTPGSPHPDEGEGAPADG